MAWTTAKLAELRDAIATGALAVGTGPSRVQYRSLAEMERIEALVSAELGVDPVTAVDSTSRSSLVEFSED